MRYCNTCGSAFQWMRTCPRDGIPTRADLDDPLVGALIGERYRVLERVGAGGMGQVYRAAHARIPSLFALKVLYGDMAHDEQMRARFAREAEVASLLQSRHIVRVADFGETPAGLLYLVMEYLDGQSLQDRLRVRGALAPAAALAIAQQIARGVSHAHERGVVHRDLKPDNVMLVTEDDEPDIVRLLDFGVARLREPSSGARLTRDGQVFGTPLYMAPEQFAGADVDVRADLYSLGVILFEMLTGAPPFDAPTIGALAAMHVTATPPTLASMRPDAAFPPELEAIVQRLLAKVPAERFASARGLIDALRPVRAAVASGAAREVVPTTTERARPIPPSVCDAISAAVVLGAPTYNRGDHAGCCEIYRDTAEALLAGELHVAARTAAGARLVTAVRRADAHENPTGAAWELRFGFDDLLAVAESHASAPGHGTAAEELAIAAAIAAPHYAAGELELVGDYYRDVASLLAARLRREGASRADVALLDEAIARAAREPAGSPIALGVIAEAFDAVRAGRSRVPFAAVVSAAHSNAVVALASCPSLDDAVQRITQAISLGAAVYNAGDFAGCARIYRECAAALVVTAELEQRSEPLASYLRMALSDAAVLDDDGAAWTLRRMFDAVLEAQRHVTSSTGA